MALLFAFYFLLFNLPQASAASLDLGIFPPIIQIDTNSPASISTPISIENFGEDTVTLSVLFKPFTASNKENGEVVFLPQSEKSSGADPFIFDKMQILDNNHNVENVTLSPGQQKTVMLHIGLPQDEVPGDYYFSIVFISKDIAIDTTNASGVSGGIATNVLLSIGPKGDANGEITEFSTPFFAEKGPVPFTVRVKNTGKYVVAPRGQILIKNMFGQTVGNVGLLPVNILAGTTRAIPDESQSPDATPSANLATRNTQHETPTAFWPESFLLGPYTVTLTVALTDKGPLYTQTIHFFGFPLVLLMALFIAIIIILYIREKVRKKMHLLTATAIFLSFLLLSPSQANAATLSNAKDIISTSRPSTAANVAIPATHTVSFTTATAVGPSGKILFTFPTLTSGDANNPASPSASTFQLNGLTSSNVAINGLSQAATFTVTSTNPSSGGTSPTILIGLTGTTTIAAGTAVTVILGAVPTIINPTTSSVTAGTARIWQINLATQDSSGVDIDTGKTKIATVDSVVVQVAVEPAFTVTTAGLGNNADFKSSSSSCASETVNAGIAATASTVDLGYLHNQVINKAGQTITVTTNGNSGYTITATSSGRFLDSGSGYFLADGNLGNGLTANNKPTPAKLHAASLSSDGFGISPCGARVPTSIWPGMSLPIGFNSGAAVSNPWNTGTNSYHATLASYSGAAVSGDVTVIRYAATIKDTTPAGLYKTVFTYVVTPTF